MLTSLYQKPAARQLNIVAGAKIRNISDTNVIASTSEATDDESLLFKVDNRLSSSKIFVISIPYLGKVFRTKVLKVIYKSGGCIYKIVLHTNIKPDYNICWLQPDKKGWIIALGMSLDKKLINSITSAIESEETY